MNEIKKADDMAFPQHTDLGSALGLTKREYFAAKALQGLLAHDGQDRTDYGIVKAAVKLADKLIGVLE